MNSKITKFAAAAVIIIVVFLAVNIFHNTIPTTFAGEILTSAIQAVQNVHSVHIKARLRTLPQDNFSYIDPTHDFVPVEIWAKQCEDGRVYMRFDKPCRQLTVDGETATMIINHNYVVQLKTSSYGVFNCDWMTKLVAVNELLENELKMAENDSKHEISVYHEEINGQDKLVLQRNSQASVLKRDYLRNKFIQNSERTFYYYFDPETKLLEGMRLFVNTGERNILIFEITDIFYDPQIVDSQFTLQIPQDAIYHVAPKVLPDNEKYTSMTPKEAALAIFTACAKENWEEVLKFESQSRISAGMKHSWGGLEIIQIGEPFQSEGYPGWFVPYEIRVKDGRIIKHNLALRNDNPANRWVIDGGEVY